MSVVCLNTYRSTRVVAEYCQGASAEPAVATDAYTLIREVIEARFANDLPAHYKRCMAVEQDAPYKHGDPSNVTYRARAKGLVFNAPSAVPCKVTPTSCLKVGSVYRLGSRCLEGLDEPFPWVDTKYGTTLAFLRLLPDGARLHVTTRSDLVATADYVAELKRLDARIDILAPAGMTDDDVRNCEPGAPSVKRRAAAVRVLQDCGIKAELVLHNVPNSKEKKA